jgi:hypothetical protein
MFVLKLYTSKRVSVLSTLEILFINIDKFPAGPQRRVAAKNILAGNEIISVVVFKLKNPTIFKRVIPLLAPYVENKKQLREGGGKSQPTKTDQRPNSWTKSKQKCSEFSSLLFTATSTALPWDFCFFKLTQPLTVLSVQLLYTVREKGGNPDRKPYPLPYSLRNPYKNLKSENSQDYDQKSHRNCMFMNSASGLCVHSRQ